MIDLDAQTNLTFSFVGVDEWEQDYSANRTIKTLFDGLMQGQPGSLAGLIIEPERARAALTGNDGTSVIQPAAIGVMFNMIQINRGEPISAQANYIEQTRRQSGLNVFPTFIRRNDTLFAGAAETGVPVVLTRQSGATYKNIVQELEQVTEEFAGSIGV